MPDSSEKSAHAPSAAWHVTCDGCGTFIDGPSSLYPMRHADGTYLDCCGDCARILLDEKKGVSA